MIKVSQLKLLVGVVFICLVGFSQQAMKAQGKINDSKDSIKTYTIENSVNEFSLEKSVKTEVGYQYWFADKDFIDGRTLKLSVVAPDQATHPPHKHIEDEFFFVLEGKAKFFLSGKTVIVGPYTSLYCPSQSMHGISNAGDTELKYLVIKKYQKLNK